MDYGFVAYIDESGDPGCTGPFRPSPGAGGQSHFLTIAAYIVPKDYSRTLVEARDRIRNEIKPRAVRRDLHFADLGHEQKARFCQVFGEMAGCITALIIGKAHFPERERFQKECAQLYWYACRVVVERISWYGDTHGDTADRKRVKIEFSDRGGTPVEDFRGYLRNLRGVDTQIRWGSINEELVESYGHEQRAGLQFADCAASALTWGVEPQKFGLTEPRYGLSLHPRLYRYRNGKVKGYGIKTWPDMGNWLSKEQSAYLEALCK